MQVYSIYRVYMEYRDSIYIDLNKMYFIKLSTINKQQLSTIITYKIICIE